MKHNKDNLFIGLMFIVAAILLITKEFGLFQGVNIFNIFISVILVYIIFKSILSRSFAGILFPLAFLCIIYAKPLGIEEITVWPVLCSAALGSIGLSLIYDKKVKTTYNDKQYHEKNGSWVIDSKIEYSDNDGEIISDVKFGTEIKYVESSNFKRAYIRNNFGESSIYFEQAIVSAEGAEIIINALFGELKLFIPKEWNVSVDVSCMLSDLSEKNKGEYVEGMPNVKIKGKVSLGECVIHYV